MGIWGKGSETEKVSKEQNYDEIALQWWGTQTDRETDRETEDRQTILTVILDVEFQRQMLMPKDNI